MTVPELKASEHEMSPMSPGTHGNAFSGAELLPATGSAEPVQQEATGDPGLPSVAEA